MHHRRPQIRIVSWGISVPERASCTACDRVFSLVPTEGMSVEEARDALERLFLAHACTFRKTEQQEQTY
jgi:hypothetical protein